MLSLQLRRIVINGALKLSRRTLAFFDKAIETTDFHTEISPVTNGPFLKHFKAKLFHKYFIERKVYIYSYFVQAKWPEHVLIKVPALSPTMTQGNIGSWKKKVGDKVSPGDVLVEIETDKATMDFECQEEGYLAKVMIAEGAKEIPVGKPLAILAENQSDIEAFKDYEAEEEQKQVSVSAESKTPQESTIPSPPSSVPSSTPSQPKVPRNERIVASPVAKFIAGNNNIDLSLVQGTGPNNRILKSDVLEAIEIGRTDTVVPQHTLYTLPSMPGTQFVDIPLSNVRKVIAQRLSESKQTIPHYYLNTEINMTKVLALREKINHNAKGAFKLSVNDFIIKACAMSMRHVPEVNSSWQGTFIRQYNKVDISVAVATESGLITPIVMDASLKGLYEISQNVKDLADLAKKGKLRPEQFQGGTFTISNLGMFGVSSFTAIINPPQSCILAVGTTVKRLIPEGNGVIGEADLMSITLSCDHRTVDGATGARWLQHLKRYLEEPAEMLV